MPELVYLNISKKCKKNTKIGLLATETTIKTGIYKKSLKKNINFYYQQKNFKLIM